MINEKRVLESFLDYIQIDSETYEEGNFAKRLEKDLMEAGLEVEFVIWTGAYYQYDSADWLWRLRKNRREEPV